MTRFDLTGQGRRLRLINTISGLALAIFVAVLGVVVANGAWMMYRASKLSGETVVGLAALAFVLSAFGVMAWVMLSPLAAAVEVDDDGVRFYGPRKPMLSLRWSDTSFALRLKWTSGSSDFVSNGRPAWTAVIGRTQWRAVLSREAFDSICEAATRHDFVVTHKSISAGGWTIFTIEPGSASPGLA